MNHIVNNWDKDALKNPDVEYQALLGEIKAVLASKQLVLEQAKAQVLNEEKDIDSEPSAQAGSQIIFVRCSPPEGEQIIKRVINDINGNDSSCSLSDRNISNIPKEIKLLKIDRTVTNFAEMLAERNDLHNADILFVMGVEEFLDSRIVGGLDAEISEHIPRPLAHLSLAQRNLKTHYGICFVFLMPLFALKFFLDSYPALFGEEVRVFEFPTDMELLRQEAFQWEGGDRYVQYANMSEAERNHKYEDLQKLIAAQPLISERRVELLLEQGGLLVAGNRCKEAIANCDLALNIRLDNHLAWYNRAVALDLIERHGEAVENYRQAIAYKPDFYMAWHNLGTSLSMLGRYEEAIDSYNMALKYKPDHHCSYGSKALVYSVMGKHEEAIEYCEKALALRSDYVQGWFSRAYALESIGRYEEAVASYDRALEYKPNDHQIWYGRAKALENWGNYTEAIASYDQAIALRPDDYYAWNNRGLVLSKLEMYEEAIASHDHALEINANDHFAWYSRGNALSGLGRIEEAIDSYDRAILISPQDTEILHSRRLALRRLGFTE
ncbi:MAG: tetratricopeptide repeat protein [Pseudanabaenaceae cyanobacterium bins.39]|nr:tetratricopeptide repeat protein [Pseudanabaenaceae cyanobacterium bins.39]